jgi:hypothetical protein
MVKAVPMLMASMIATRLCCYADLTAHGLEGEGQCHAARNLRGVCATSSKSARCEAATRRQS